MEKTNDNFFRNTAVMTVLLAAYFVASLYRSDVWGVILSPTNAFMAAGILFYAYLKSQRTIKVSTSLLLFSLACVVWGIADIIWVIISFSGGSPEENPILWVIYVLTNCLLLLSLIVFAIHQCRKWAFVQLGIDMIISGLLTVVLFWILFLNKDISVLNALIESDFTSVLSIITDILICISIFSWFLSVRGGKIPVFIRIISSGLVLFSFVDMYYYYLEYNGFYFPNSLNDFMYILSLVIIAFGALWKTHKKGPALDYSVMTNIGGKRRWIYLLMYPFFTILLSIAGTINTQLNVVDMLTFAVLIFVYWASCRYIQISLEKEALLKRNNEILEQRVAEQLNELTFLTNQDTLTTLFNRRYFMTRLDEAIRNKDIRDTTALLIINVDRFKTINDTFGHDVGDKILIDLSYRLSEWNQYGATIARLGGDEFAVLLTDRYTQKDIEMICKELMAHCCKSLSIGDNTLNLTMSAGIAIVSTEAYDGKTLMQNADIAMCRAKSQGYNKYQIYDTLMRQDYRKTIEIESLLRQTNTEKDFELYYQPQYALPDKVLIGAEALIRWKHPEHGFIPPNVFIPIAEQIDYIFKIGRWVMQESIRQAGKWNQKYELPLKVGFNISPKQFQEKNFISHVKTMVTESGVNPLWIDAEVTESVMMNDGECIRNVFSVFNELGITVSIDDFGSGYSALGHLNKYSFDRIKIDKSLIDNVSLRSINGVNIVRAVINMAHASGIKTIAEGVETQEQLDILVELDCDQIQGYLLGRPVPAGVFEERYIKQYCKKITCS